MTTEIEFLTDVQLDVIFFIERFHSTVGTTPTREQIDQRFTGLDDEFWEDFKTNKQIIESFHIRGIIWPAVGDSLTAEQMHAIAIMTDLVDRRSDEKKLRDLGLTSRKWAAWLQDDNFARYLRDRSEKLLENSVHEAHKGLLKGVRNGNVASIKTLYEITGRFDPTKEVQIDVRRVLHTFIEIIQKYVRDPVMMHQIAMDLSEVATAESYSTGLTNQMMDGAHRQRQITGRVIGDIKMPPEVEGLND